MYIRIIVNLFIVSSWYIKVSESQRLEPCPSNVNIIHVCTDNDLNDLTSVFVSTGYAPLQQAIECTCTITLLVSSDYSLSVEGASAYHDENTNFTFAFNGVTVKDNTNFIGSTRVDLTGETVLKYSSPNNDTILVCLYISALTDEDHFNISCSDLIHDSSKTTSTTTTSTTELTQVIQTSKKYSSDMTETRISLTSDRNHYTQTVSSTDGTDINTELQTNNDTIKDNSTLIAAVIGAISGIVLTILVVLTIMYCKRKRRSMPNEGSQPTSSSTVNLGDNSGMQQNQAYESLNDIQPNQTPYDILVVSQDTINDNTTPTLNYENMRVDITCQEVGADNYESYYNLSRHKAAHSEVFENVVSVDKDTITYENTKVNATCHEENIDK